MPIASRLSRRGLLSGAAAIVATSTQTRRGLAQSAPKVSEAAWRELGARITGGVIRPGDPRFVWLTQPENLRYFNPPANPGGRPDPDAPFGVVRPRTPEEVAYAIAWARDNKLPMVPRSGGHSFAGCSTVPGLVINSTAMRDVSLEQDKLVAVGGGAQFGNMLDAMREARSGDGTGRYTITHGRCPTVGLSAFLMGGGWSLDSPHAGMGCDQIRQVEIVLADGSIQHASEINNPELFWAVRGGGGGNLGFVTKWWLRPTPVASVTAFSGTWRLKDNAYPVFQALLGAIDAAPDRMGALISVARTAATVASPWPYQVKLACQLHGTRDEFMTLLAPALVEADMAERMVCGFNDCTAQTLLELPYWDAQDFFAEHVLPNRYQETSLFTREISDKAINELFRIWASWPGQVLGSRWAVYRTGGKVNTVAPEATAFPHRSSRWMITTDIDWSASDTPQAIDTNLRWQRDVHDALDGMMGGLGSFYNFPDPGLKDHAKAYWGSNLARLATIKRQVDPQSVFTPPRNQGIVT